MERASWDDVWMDDAFSIKRRSLCTRSGVGVVIVNKDNEHLTSAYNGPAPRLSLTESCDHWCPRGRVVGPGTGQDYGLSCLAVHAEVNAVMRASWREMQGGTLYSTRTPCSDCVKIIAACGVDTVVFYVQPEDVLYRPEESIAYLEQMQIDVVIRNPEVLDGTA